MNEEQMGLFGSQNSLSSCLYAASDKCDHYLASGLEGLERIREVLQSLYLVFVYPYDDISLAQAACLGRCAFNHAAYPVTSAGKGEIRNSAK